MHIGFGIFLNLIKSNHNQVVRKLCFLNPILSIIFNQKESLKDSNQESLHESTAYEMMDNDSEVYSAQDKDKWSDCHLTCERTCLFSLLVKTIETMKILQELEEEGMISPLDWWFPAWTPEASRDSSNSFVAMLACREPALWKDRNWPWKFYRWLIL